MAKNKQNSGGGAPKARDFREIMFSEALEMTGEALGETSIRLLRNDQVVYLANLLPMSWLTDADARNSGTRMMAVALGLAMGWDQSFINGVQGFLYQGFEEVGKIAPSIDPSNNTAARNSIRTALGTKRSLLSGLKGAKKEDKPASDGRRPGMDYFQAKAAIKDAAQLDGLRRLEIVLKANRPDDYKLLMGDGAHNMRVTPEELTSLVPSTNGAAETDMALDQLVALMKGPRGMGATSVKAKSIVDKLLGATLNSGSVMGANATDMGDQAEKWAQDSKTAREKRKYT